MEISPFFVYAVLKLDAIRILFMASFMIFFVLTILFFCLGMYYKYSETDEHGNRLTNKQIVESKQVGNVFLRIVFPVLLFLFTICVLTATFLPSAKQAAVIWLLPKIATEENLDKVQSEAGELYDLAKQWLKEKEDPQVNRKAENDDQANQ